MIPVTGINYPWSSFQGRSNYGCDFGANVWGTHSGVSANRGVVSQDFAAIASLGFEVARWFVFTDGRGGIRFDAEGQAAGLVPGCFDDLDAAFEIAAAHRLRLCLVLFDYLWMNGATLENATYAPNPAVLATPDGQARLFGTVIEPFVDRYGGAESLHSIDVINEPDWVTDGLEFRRPWWKRNRGSTRPFKKHELRALVSGVAARVHARSRVPVTVGGGRVKHAAEWDDPAYGLDFIQLHAYPDPGRDHSLAGVSAAALGVSKPVLIGEFPANGDRQLYFGLAADAGYVGAWPWSFKGHDAVGEYRLP